MVNLANVLREIASAADYLLPLCPPVEMDGCLRQVAVVELRLHLTETGYVGRNIRVRVHRG